MKESLCSASHAPSIRMAEPETWMGRDPDTSLGCHEEDKAKSAKQLVFCIQNRTLSYLTNSSSTYKEYEIEESEEDLGEARSAVGHHGEQDGLQQPETKGLRG